MELSSDTSLSGPSPLVAMSAPALGSLHDELGALNASVADKFLALAAGLQSVAAKARDLAALSREATSLAAEGESDKAFSSLQQILSDAEHAEVLADTSRIKLRDILARLQQSKQPLSRLSKLRSLLHSLSTLSRIEASRMINSKIDLSGLAKDIDELAQDVESNLVSIAEQADSLVGIVKNGIKQLDDIKSAEGTQAANLIAQTRAVLDPLHERAEASKETARNTDEQYAAMRQATDKIVMSLQAEDIARQRVEHIQEALLRSEQLALSGDSGWVSTVALQRSQLSSTRSVLANAVETIASGLDSLNGRAGRLIQETESLSETIHADQRSFEAATRDGFGAVASIFAQYSDSARTVLSTVDTVVSAVKGMTDAANRLEDIELSMRLIAVNAAIKTAQLGSDGQAMSVIATALQNSASESESHTQIVLECLAGMSSALDGMSNHGASSANSALINSDEATVRATVEQLADCVKKTHVGLTQRIDQLLQLGGTITEDLHSALQLALAARDIDSEFAAAETHFVDLLAPHGGIEVALQGQDTTQDLSKLYSMQSERDIHEQMFGGATGQPAPDSAADLDDGVELF